MRFLIMALLVLVFLACSPPPDPTPTSPPPMSERQREVLRAQRQFDYGVVITDLMARAVDLYYNQCSRVRNLKDDVINGYEHAMREMAGLLPAFDDDELRPKSDAELLEVRAVIEVAQDAVYMLEDRCRP